MKQPHSLLLVVEKPDHDASRAKGQHWLELVVHMEGILRRAKGSERLGENLWLIVLEKDLELASRALGKVADVELPYRVLFLDEEQKWIVSNRAE